MDFYLVTNNHVLCAQCNYLCTTIQYPQNFHPKFRKKCIIKCYILFLGVDFISTGYENHGEKSPVYKIGNENANYNVRSKVYFTYSEARLYFD